MCGGRGPVSDTSVNTSAQEVNDDDDDDDNDDDDDDCTCRPW